MKSYLVLALLAAAFSLSATAETTIKSTKSNASLREQTSMPSTPSPGPIEATTVKGSKSNGSSYRDSAPAVTQPLSGAVEATLPGQTVERGKPSKDQVAEDCVPQKQGQQQRQESTIGGAKQPCVEGLVNTSKSNTFREAAPAPAPTAEATTVKGSKSNSDYREAAPVPAPTAEATTVKGSKSNSDNRSVAPASSFPTGPSAAPAATTTINSTKSNTFREATPPSDATKSDDCVPQKQGQQQRQESTIGGARQPCVERTINTTKSNSYREGNPQPGKPSGAEVDRTINNSKSNSFREANQQPENPKPMESINLNSSRSNIYRQANPQPVKPTSGQAGIAVDDPDAPPADKFRFSK